MSHAVSYEEDEVFTESARPFRRQKMEPLCRRCFKALHPSKQSNGGIQPGQICKQGPQSTNNAVTLQLTSLDDNCYKDTIQAHGVW